MSGSKKNAVYPGSFDPIHRGHCDIIERAARIFDVLIVAVSNNQAKGHSAIEGRRRAELVCAAVGHLSNVVVKELKTGLLVDFCVEHQAGIIVKGLRQQHDIAYELPMATVNYDMKKIETFFLGARPEFSQISSSIIRQLCEVGGDIAPYVPKGLAWAIAKHLG